MALSSLPVTFTKMFLSPQRKPTTFLASSNVSYSTSCRVSNKHIENPIVHRRSTNFTPTIWTDDYIQSLSTVYKEEKYLEQSKLLRNEVRKTFGRLENHLDQLELIDELQRLGIAYHFSNEIKNILDNIYNMDAFKRNNNLYATSLEFRLLRQHGYDVSTDIFSSFQDEKGNLKKCLSIDIEGMLSLYEASFHSYEGEAILDEARDFTSKFLEEYLNQERDYHISLLISHALELPLHWRLLRWETQWFINAYEKKQNKNPTLLQLAKLDFNFVQATYQDELKYTSRWWKTLGLVEKLKFCRDRIAECAFWAVGMNFEPDHGYCRIVMTKIIALITTIDDVYDVYGTIEELELFTEAIQRWDINAIDHLPDYMKTCFHALNNFVEELGSEMLKKINYDITPLLKKTWKKQYRACLVESKWCHNGYTPSLEKYIDNAKISISAPLLALHAFCLLPHTFKEEDLVYFEEYSDIIQYTGVIFRLANDIGSYKREKEAGDVAKSLQCCMNESGASEEEACEHLKSIISITWKKLNKETRDTPFSRSIIDTALNLARMALCAYWDGDGFTFQDLAYKNRIQSILIQPFPVTCVEK